MLVADVIYQSRARLGDEAKNRWTDERLLYIAGQGQKQLCKLAGVLRKEVLIPLYDGVLRYKLPDDCITVRRVEYKDKYVPVVSRGDTDDMPDVSLYSRDKFVAVKNNLSMGKLDIYPNTPEMSSATITYKKGYIAEVGFEVIPSYGVVSNSNGFITITPTFGEVTSIEYDFNVLQSSTMFGEIKDSSVCTPAKFGYSNSDRGVVTQILIEPLDSYGVVVSANKGAKIAGTYGIITDVVSSDSFMRIFYEAIPLNKLNIGGTMSIPDVWEDAMVQYVVGTALQDDNDATNNARGEAMLAKFTSEVLKGRELASKDFSGGIKDKMTTNFRRI